MFAGRRGITWTRPVDVFAGVMVLSEVAQRLMMMSGSGASTSAAEYGQAATSRMNEVATTPSQRDIASPAGRTRNYKIVRLPSPHPSRMMCRPPKYSEEQRRSFGRWRPSPFLMPILLASFMPHALRGDHFFVR
jgi:hypothetical protein